MSNNEEHASMAEILEKLDGIYKQLEKAGISAEQAEEVRDVMDDYVTTKEEIIKARDEQFSEDAQHILASMKIYSAKNDDILSRFLRQFAEHVAQQTLEVDKTIRAVADIVDRTPTMQETIEYGDKREE